MKKPFSKYLYQTAAAAGGGESASLCRKQPEGLGAQKDFYLSVYNVIEPQQGFSGETNIRESEMFGLVEGLLGKKTEGN